jgi:transposase-like protein
MRRHYTAEKRAQLVELVTSSGITIAAAAAQLDVHISTASYWVRQATKVTHRARRAIVPTKASAATPTAPTFARLVRGDETSAIEVWISGVAIRVNAGFDAALLRAVVGALSGGAA